MCINRHLSDEELMAVWRCLCDMLMSVEASSTDSSLVLKSSFIQVGLSRSNTAILVSLGKLLPRMCLCHQAV